MAQLLTVIQGKQTGETIYFELIECYKCGIPFMVPQKIKARWLSTGDEFYCPQGHCQVYSKSTEQILNEKLESQRRQHEKEIEETNNRLLDEITKRRKEQALRKKSERQLKRIHKGVCPCCNRTFTNLANHMKTKHPEVSTSIVANALQVKISNK